MGFEMIKDKLALTPHRLFAMVQLVSHLKNPRRTELLNLAQPVALLDNQDTAKIVYRYARNYGLIVEDEAADHRVSLGVPIEFLATFEAFRHVMQAALLGVTEANQDNFLLSQFTAWYATQDERVLSYSKTEYEANFHSALYPHVNDRVLAEEPGISAWRTWAEFLGWGWPLKFSTRDEMRIVPDATNRIKPLLKDILPNTESGDVFAYFISELGSRCPELDGGVLFEQAWVASRGSEQRGNRLSLMLSTALRVLYKQGEIELINRSDASDIWTLFPTQSYINQVTHIRRKVSV